MKKKLSFLILNFVFLLFANTLLGQNKYFSLGLDFGVNFSDVNYGTDFLTNKLPIDDYQSSETLGGGDWGFNIGLAAETKISKRFLLLTNLNFSRLNYSVEGSVSNLRSNVNRPMSSDIPVSLKGKVKYSFLDIQTGIAYSFNNNIRKGWFALVTLNDLIHLDTQLDIEGISENGNPLTDFDDSELNDPEYNNLFLIGGGAGYHFQLIDRLTISPMFTYKYGLNAIVDETIEPMIIDLRVNLKWWF